MPKMTADIPDIESTFVRPALMEILKDVIERTSFPKTDKVYLLGETYKTPTPGSTEDDRNEYRSVSTDNATVVEVTEDYNDTDIANVSYPNYTTPSIMIDDSMDLKLKTIYIPTTYTLSATMRFSSLSKAKSWVHKHVLATKMGRTTLAHKFTGSYPLPAPAILLVGDMHTKAKVNYPTLPDFKDWFEEHITDRYALASDHGGKRTGVMISDTHTGVLGAFDFDKAPDPVRRRDDNSWEVSLDYKVRLEKPAFIHASYPLIAYNTPLDSVLIKNDIPQSVLEENDRSDRIVQLTKHFTKHMRYFSDSQGIPIPYYDDWEGNVDLPNAHPALKIQCIVNPSNPRTLGDLSNIISVGNGQDEVKINEDLLSFVMEDPDMVKEINGSPLHVAVFKGKHRLISNMVTIDPSLIVGTDEDMDVRSNYHLVIYLMTDMRHMYDESKERLRKNPDLFIKICDAIYPGLRDKMMSDPIDSGYWHIRTDNSLSKIGFKEIIYRGAKLYGINKMVDAKFSRDVMKFTVVAWSRS